ncbi:MAG: cytokinin riboside 5'-monophosphate phosphoribohydrolase [Rhodomicrobium sp.]|nr:MAG: cytokinin riboside 5'-monophosphate phosphoribohydrolase [Rhodomicrobium sp.]
MTDGTTHQPLNENIKSICVFCGSGNGKNPAFISAAAALGALLATRNIHLIFGGGDMGLMGAAAKAARGAGGQVTGIIPEFLLKYQNSELIKSETIITPDMHSRKAAMYAKADGFIALPGGIGTLEELVETMTWEQLGQHTKPIILLNIEKFWQPFLKLLHHMNDEAFIRPGLEVNLHVIDEVNDLKALLPDHSL